MGLSAPCLQSAPGQAPRGTACILSGQTLARAGREAAARFDE